MLICLLFEVLLSKRKLLNVTRYSCFSVLYLLYYKISPPVSPFYHSIQLYKEKISDSLSCLWKSFQSIKQPTMFLSVLTLTGRYEWVSVQLSSRQKAKAEVLISFYYRKVCCLFTCCFVNNAQIYCLFESGHKTLDTPNC